MSIAYVCPVTLQSPGMSILALNRRFLVGAVVPLVLLTGCPDDPVPAEDTGQTDTENPTTTTADTTSAVDSTTSAGPSTSSESTDSDSTTAVATTESSSSSSEGGSTGPLPGVCGNNIVEEEEACDLSQINGETCESLGFEGGHLGCLLTCEDYNTLGCFICGNEVVDLAEDCEETVPEHVTCEGLGFQAGWITCGDDCLFDISECSICGDGLQSGPEECDGIDFDNQTCLTVGFAGGNLACNLAECAFVYSGCQGGQYTQDFEASLDVPEEFYGTVSGAWLISEQNPIAGARSARSGDLPLGGVTNLTLDVSFPAVGNVSFAHREDTASGWDFLRFYRDGVLQQSWTGNNLEALYSAPVPPGDHTFQWRFERAGFVDAGMNAVWIDDIVIDGGVPL
jgi:hypothetical protein